VSAPLLAESIPTVTAPLPAQDAAEPMPRAWFVAATVAGVIAALTGIVGLVVLS
jgi:hypothetical protein